MSSYAFWTAVWQGLLASIMCLGVFISFRIIRFPDLTCDGSYPLGACVAGDLILRGYNPFLATVIAVLCGGVAGAITGFLNVKLKIPAIVASILVMTALYSVDLIIMNAPILSLSKSPSVFGGVESFISQHNMILDRYHIRDAVYPLVFLLVVFFMKKLLDWFLHTEVGLTFRAAGDNPKMASTMGVNTQTVVWVGLAMANGLIALTGALFAQVQKFADVNLGMGMIIVGLASVFIGEAIEKRLFKKESLYIATAGVIVGSLIYKFSIALAYEMGLSTDYFNLLTSIIVAIALLVPSVRKDILVVIRRDV